MATDLPSYKDVLKLYIEFMSSYYNVNFIPSNSFIYDLRDSMINGTSDEFLNKHILHIRKLKNYIFYWLDMGFDEEQSSFYAKHYKEYLICKYCNKLYKKGEGFNVCCCEDHYIKYRSIVCKNISDAKLKYNNRDPVQYAKKHNIDLEEAKKITKTISRNGSHLTIDYWVNRGVSEEEAKIKISRIQSINSNRTILHWMNKGFNEEEAKLKVAKIQSYNCKKKNEKYESVKQFSPWCVEYWVRKGKPEEEAKLIISNNAARWNKIRFENTTKDDRKKQAVFCKEYWIKHFPEDWKARYITFFSSISTPKCRSKIADEFCLMLDEKFSGIISKRYFITNEYTRYFEEFNNIVKYDYVDTTLKIAVEFNGDYWHANPTKYNFDSVIVYPNNIKFTAYEIWERDKLKISLLENIGYKVYIVWQSDFIKNKELLVNNLYEEILNESR